MKNVFFILILGVLLYACKKDADDYVAPEIGHKYAGLTLGKYVVYDVDSLFYDDFTASVDTAIYQIKELVAEAYTDLEGEEAYKINRYRRDHDTLSWVLIDVWNAKLTQTNFQKAEENVRYVKLIFPIGNGKVWNGNSMNTMAEWEYEYESIDQSENIGGNALAKVLMVNQLENINLIEEQQFLEKYAENVGLVYKRSKDLVRDNLSSPWRGYDVTYTVKSYGN